MIVEVEGLRRPDGGSISVLGMDPQRSGYRLRRRIGIQLQETGLPNRVRVGEAPVLFASFYEEAVPWEPLLERFGLTELSVREPSLEDVFLALTGREIRE